MATNNYFSVTLRPFNEPGQARFEGPQSVQFPFDDCVPASTQAAWDAARETGRPLGSIGVWRSPIVAGPWHRVKVISEAFKAAPEGARAS